MEEKIIRFEKLRQLVAQCRACPLHESRPNFVFGEGSLQARIMFVGEAPGKEERATGRPFVGRSGKLLRSMIAAIDIPETDYFIANIIKDRPPNNRPPEKEEIESCVKFLKKQIEIISPQMLMFLGKTAIKGLCPNLSHMSVEMLRSQSKSLGMINYQEIPVLVTYHPSALLRTPWRKVGAAEDFRFLQSTYREIKEIVK
jgi:uracil-DNA glycosylase